MDRRRTAVPRTARSPLSLSISLAAAGLLASFSSADVLAACTPGVPTNGVTVTCTAIDQQDFDSSASNLTVNIIPSAIVSSSGSGSPVIQLTGSNNTLVNSGQIYPSNSGQQSQLTTGLKVGNSNAQNISITNNSTGWISGTGANLGPSIFDLKGMALDVQAGAGGKVTLVNNGTIFSDPILGATLEVADMPNVAVYGGAQVEMTNTNQLYGRVAFQASAEGNVFTNTGSLVGSLSMGAGGGNNRFNAVTGSSLHSGGVFGASAVTVASNPDLVFVAPGMVDGGAGGSNTLALQNAVGGGFGSAGSGNISSAGYLNFSNLLVQSGTWTVSGALLTGASTSTSLSGGVLSVNNGAVFGTSHINANGATLMSHTPSTLILANDINLGVNFLSGIHGLTVSGSNNITLAGVISGNSTSPLTKNGTGALRLNGSNTYTGNTLLNAGSLVIGSSEALGTGAVSAANGTRIDSGSASTLSNNFNVAGTVSFGGNSTLALSGTLQGDGTAVVNKDGAGTLVLSGTNTYGGGTTLSAGTLLVGNNAALGSGMLTVSGASNLGSTASVVLNNAVALNSNLTVSGDNALRLNGNISGGAANKLIKTGQGNLTLAGTNNFQGGIELNGGTLTVATNSGALGSGAVTVTGDSRLAYNAAQVMSTPIAINSGVTLEFANNVQVIQLGQISGSGTLAKTGTDELMLFMGNSFSGLLDVRQGTVNAAVANALGNNPDLLVGSGATVSMMASSSINSLGGSGEVNLASGSLFTVGAGNASSTFSGVLSGAGNLNKVGTGTLTLEGLNAFTGNTTVSAGRLNIASTGKLASNLVTVGNGATLGGSGTLVGGVTINNGGHLAVTSASTLNTGSLTLASGSNLDIGLGTPTIATPMLNVTGNVTISNSTFNFSDVGGLANGIYRLFNYTGSLVYGGANPGIFPADVVLGQITLSLDSVAKTANIVVNSPALSTQYWDGNTSLANGSVDGGSGIWHTANTNWTKSTGASNDVWKGVSAVFQAASGTVFIEGTQNVSALQFKSDGYGLIAGTAGGLNLVNGTGGAAVVTVDSNVAARIEAPLSGTGKLQKSGAGTLILAGSNSYSGGTTLSAGTLVLRHDSALGSSALRLASGTTLRADNSDVQLSNDVALTGVSNIAAEGTTRLALNGVVSGAGGLVKIGTGNLELNGNNAQLGNTWLNAGGLVLGSSTALGSGALNTANNTTLDSRLPGVSVGNNVLFSGNLTVLGTQDLSLTGMVVGSGNLIKDGASTLNLAGANSLTGTVTLNQGTLRLGQDTSLGNASLVVGGASTLQAAANIALSNAVTLGSELTVSGGNDLTLNGVVSGAAGLVKEGSGKLTLSGTNLYQGNTTLNAGTLVLGNAGALGHGRLDVAGSAALESASALTVGNDVTISGDLTVQGSDNLTLDGSVTGMGSLTKAGTGTLTLNGGNGFYGTYNVDGGRLVSSTAITLGEPSAINVASGATLQLVAGAATGQLNGAGSVQLDAGQLRVDEGTFSGALSGNGDLYKNGSGTLLLSGTSHLAGATTVAGGTLRVDGNLGNGSVWVENGAALAGSGALGGAVTVANGGHLNLAGGSVLTLGSLVLNDSSNLDVALGSATPGAAGLANVTTDLTLDGTLNITDAGGFGIGVYRLFDYGGLLTDNGLGFGALPGGVPRNELELQTSVANQINLVVGGAADIRFWDGSQLAGNSIVEGGNGTWNSTNSNWTTTHAGLNQAWNSTFAVFQGAAGTVTVDGTQSVSGLQFINDYTLAGGSAGQLQLTNGISGYTAVRVDSGKTATLDVNLTGNGLLNKLDSGTLVLNSANTYSGGTRLSAGTLVVGNNDALGSGSLTTAAGTTLDTLTALSLINDLHLDGALTLGGSHDLVLNGLVLGNGALVKNGSGTLTLNQANNYMGTTLNAGTLVLGNSAALGAGQLTVAGVTSLDTSAAMTLGNAINLGVNASSRLTLAGNHDLTLSGALIGNGTLVKQGTSTLDLTGSSNFFGAYQIDGGRLNLLGSNASNAPQVSVGTGAMLGVGADSTLHVLSGQGTVQLYNNSVLTLRNGTYYGSLTGTGSLNIASGLVALAGVSNINGATTVSSGSLYAHGALTTSSLAVANGATLGGKGSVNGAVTIADGGHVQLLHSNTLTTGALALNNGSNLDAFLGAAVAGDAGLLKVNGNLVLDGKLNVTDVGGFGLGVYRLIDYTGSLTDNGLAIGTIPGGLVAGDLEVQTSVTNQVNLLVGGAAGSVLFWDGTGTGPGNVAGGSGTWGGATNNWTNASGNFNQNWNNGFAVFQGAAGTVTVEGTQTATGLQFASDGYSLVAGNAGQLNLINASTGFAGVRVGSGQTATVDVNLSGSATLNKLEAGTLVLNGNNSYSGGTQLSGGTLVLGSNTALGSGTLTTADLTTLDSNRAISLGNAMVLNGGLILAGSNDLSLAGNISGAGALAKNGNTHLTLSGSNSYQGGTLLNAGSLTLGHNAALGTGALAILGNTYLDTSAALQVGNAIAISQQLTLTGSHDLSLSGVLSGNGALIKNGSGQLLLTGNSTYTGNTAVNAGGLTVNGTFASANVQVASGASLAGSGTLTGQVSLADGATLNVASATAPLTVGGLSLASASNLNFALGAPDTPTTLVKVNGNLTLDGILNISNASGFGIGVYQLFRYGGSLSDNGLTLGNLPANFLASQMTLQTALANQVNLVVDEGDGDLLFWNGSKTHADGTISGGDGVWGANTNWTNSTGKNANGWSGGQFAVFGGQSGTVTLEGQRSFSGIQFLSGGYQLVGNAGSALEAVNAADGSLASVRVAGDTSALIAARLVGSGGINKLDGGTLVLSGANTYSGGTTVSGGVLMGNTVSLQGDIVDNASLVFQQDVNGTFGGNLSGTGSAFKRGAGTLLFNGDHSFSGDFVIQEGVLQVGETAASAPATSFARFALFAAPVGNTLAANVVVAGGAGLTGTGTVNSVINHGIVQPGANGNLTVSGDFTNASDGALNINLTPLPTSHLAVGGTAKLAGTLNVFAAAPYTGDTSYTLLTADGGISGKFDSDNIASLGIASKLAFIDTSLRYGAHDVTLSMARNNTAFADVALSDNQRGVAAALDSAAAPASLRSAITTMDRASAQAAFDSLSGEIHASTTSVLLEDSRYVRNTVNDRMRQGDCGNGDPRSVLAPTSGQQSSSGCQGQGVGWITALGGWASNDGGQGVASVDRDLSGFMLGFDNNLSDEWRAGIAAGYTKTSLDASKRNADASIDSYHLASYLNYQLDAFAARMGVGYSWHDIDSKRHAGVGGNSQELKAKYKAGTAQVFGEVGYAVEAAGVALEPFAGIAYVNYDSDTAREKGGAGALQASSKQDATFTTVGLRMGKQFALDNGTTVTPRGSLGWRHAFGDTHPDADLRFVDGGAAFSTQGVPIAKDAAVVEAGLDVSVGAAGKVGLGYSGQLSSDNRDHAVTVSFSMGF